MGKGIALEFKRRFPEMFFIYRDICKGKTIHPGDIWPYKAEPICVDSKGRVEYWRWIFNCAVKNHWRNPSKLEWVERCLQRFVEYYQHYGIRSAAFSWMGAGCGQLPFERIQ